MTLEELEKYGRLRAICALLPAYVKVVLKEADRIYVLVTRTLPASDEEEIIREELVDELGRVAGHSTVVITHQWTVESGQIHRCDGSFPFHRFMEGKRMLAASSKLIFCLL